MNLVLGEVTDPPTAEPTEKADTNVVEPTNEVEVVITGQDINNNIDDTEAVGGGKTEAVVGGGTGLVVSGVLIAATLYWTV